MANDEAYSPAVRRALERAERSRADYRSRDLLHELLEEESLVWERLATAGGQPADLKTILAFLPGDFRDGASLLQMAEAEIIRGEPLTGDNLLSTLLRKDPALASFLAANGVDVARLFGSAVPVVAEPAEPIEAPRFDFTAEILPAARTIDANANRVRESLRVLDDHTRFALDDALLTEEIKVLRHAFAEAMEIFDPALLLTARETTRDVGTAITAGGEYERSSLHDLATVNLKRVQEALRSIEEHAKVGHGNAASRFEALRYRTYTLERTIGNRRKHGDRLAGVKLCVLLTGAQCEASLDWTIAEAAAGGAGMFQLREKGLSDADLLKRARDVRRWTRKANALFIVNDRPDIARLSEADGVHLGQDDLPVMEARAILGPEGMIGVSAHEIEQVARAVRDGADYLGVGPTFPSSTKKFDHHPGLPFVQAVAAMTRLPFFVIGGVNAANIDSVVASGGRRVAVSAAVAKAPETRDAARLLCDALSG